MTRRRPHSATPARALVWIASRMVPRSERGEWLAEWHGELCHACTAPGGDPVGFALGAFRDALWIRSNDIRPRIRPLLRGSASRCIAALVLATAIGLFSCAWLTGPRQAMAVALSSTPYGLVTISSDGYAGTQSPSISLSEYREWTRHAPQMFTQSAFCRPTMRRLRIGYGPAIDLHVVIASKSLLRMLQLSRTSPRAGDGAGRQLFLTQSTWRVAYHADPGVIGAMASAGGQPVVIAGVLPAGGWHLPGQAQALLTEDPSDLDALPSNADGFVFARLRSSVFPGGRDAWHSIFDERRDSILQFDCIPLGEVCGQPIDIFLFALLAACIALPATTALRLGEYPERHRRVEATATLRRWSFLLAKLLLVVLIVGTWCFVLAYADFSPGSPAALYFQFGTTFPALLGAFRWVLHDQRRRCPVCLRLLANPARVGQPSCNFLEWCGTEWMCQSGHGLLHIPEMPTCWFSTPRWLTLDASWASLFPAGPAAP